MRVALIKYEFFIPPPYVTSPHRYLPSLHKTKSKGQWTEVTLLYRVYPLTMSCWLLLSRIFGIEVMSRYLLLGHYSVRFLKSVCKSAPECTSRKWFGFFCIQKCFFTEYNELLGKCMLLKRITWTCSFKFSRFSNIFLVLINPSSWCPLSLY